jgi:copper(I)-binding protein
MKKSKSVTLKAFALLAFGMSTSMNGLAGDLIVAEAWARETPPGKSMTAAYGRLQNPGDETLVVTGVSAEVAARSSLHETRIERDRSTMRPVSNLTIAPGEEVELAPGGMHVMLMKLDAPLVEGESIDICFKLENNEELCSAFPIAKRKMMGHKH